MLGGVIEWWDEYRGFAFLDFLGFVGYGKRKVVCQNGTAAASGHGNYLPLLLGVSKLKSGTLGKMFRERFSRALRYLSLVSSLVSSYMYEG